MASNSIENAIADNGGTPNSVSVGAEETCRDVSHNGLLRSSTPPQSRRLSRHSIVRPPRRRTVARCCPPMPPCHALGRRDIRGLDKILLRWEGASIRPPLRRPASRKRRLPSSRVVCPSTTTTTVMTKSATTTTPMKRTKVVAAWQAAAVAVQLRCGCGLPSVTTIHQTLLLPTTNRQFQSVTKLTPLERVTQKE